MLTVSSELMEKIQDIHDWLVITGRDDVRIEITAKGINVQIRDTIRTQRFGKAKGVSR